MASVYYERFNGRVDHYVRLRKSFFDDGILYDPYKIDKIEIWKTRYDPEYENDYPGTLLLDTIYGSRIILSDIGNNDTVKDFYGLRYNRELRFYPTKKDSEELVYAGGDEIDYRNNMVLFQKLNTDVLACVKQGKSHCDKRKMPEVLKTAIIEYLGL